MLAPKGLKTYVQSYHEANRKKYIYTCDLCVGKDFLKCTNHEWKQDFLDIVEVALSAHRGSCWVLGLQGHPLRQFYLSQPDSSSELSTLLMGKLTPRDTGNSLNPLPETLCKWSPIPLTSWKPVKATLSQLPKFGEMPSSFFL